MKKILFFLFSLFFFRGVLAEESLVQRGPVVPVEIVDRFKEGYSAEELLLIEKDYLNIKDLCFDGCSKSGELVYLATAGGPGASKSTILENVLAHQNNFVYLDPDQRALKFMIHTYLQSLSCYQISRADSYQKLLQNAYTKWRGASNYIANTIFNDAFIGGYNIAHGTTSTSKAIEKLYKKLKENGYKIKLLLCGSSDQNRVNAINHRSKVQGFCQVAKQDVIDKGKWFFERLPIYFKYADELDLFWTDNFLHGSSLVATYNKTTGLKAFDQEGMNKFKKAYDEARKESMPEFTDLFG